MALSQKENSLLKDLKGEEKLCITKYTKHAEAANDPQLKSLFSRLASVEQGHLDVLERIGKGDAPQMSAVPSEPHPIFTEKYGQGDSGEKQNDCYLCTDLLTIEKHASSLYDTCVFEFVGQELRDALNHIQREEQEHGKMIYDYMSKNNMYS